MRHGISGKKECRGDGAAAGPMKPRRTEALRRTLVVSGCGQKTQGGSVSELIPKKFRTGPAAYSAVEPVIANTKKITINCPGDSALKTDISFCIEDPEVVRCMEITFIKLMIELDALLMQR